MTGAISLSLVEREETIVDLFDRIGASFLRAASGLRRRTGARTAEIQCVGGSCSVDTRRTTSLETSPFEGQEIDVVRHEQKIKRKWRCSVWSRRSPDLSKCGI